MRKFPRWAFWIIAASLSLAFLLTGISKLAGPAAQHWAIRFSRWHYPPYSSVAVGVLEIICGVGLLLNRSRKISAVILMLIMAGALCTHLLFGEYVRLVAPLLLGSLCFVLYFFDTYDRD